MRYLSLSLLLVLITPFAAAAEPTDCPAQPTGDNATYIFTEGAASTASDLAAGDALYVLLADGGQCVGSATWQDASFALTVWGDDSQTSDKDGAASGDELAFYTVDDSGTMIELSLQLDEGSATYSSNGIGVVSSVYADRSTATDEVAATGFALGEAAPNPFGTQTSLELTSDQGGMTTVTLFDATGRRVTTLLSAVLPPQSKRRITVDADGLGAGLYFVRASSPAASETRQLLLVR